MSSTVLSQTSTETGWDLGAEQTIGNLEVFTYSRKRDQSINYRTDISFHAHAKAVQEYDRLASQNDWSKCERWVPTPQHCDMVECLVSIPNETLGQSLEIFAILHALSEPLLGGVEAFRARTKFWIIERDKLGSS